MPNTYVLIIHGETQGEILWIAGGMKKLTNIRTPQKLEPHKNFHPHSTTTDATAGKFGRNKTSHFKSRNV